MATEVTTAPTGDDWRIIANALANVVASFPYSSDEHRIAGDTALGGWIDATDAERRDSRR
jgi:hypothetical protein